MDWIMILIAALLSGLVGVTISTRSYQRNERGRAKLQVLQQLLGNRYDLRGHLFIEALNQVVIAFHDSQDVKKAIRAFQEVTSSSQQAEILVNRKPLDLFKAIFKHLNIDTEPLTDDFFLRAFKPKP